VALGRAIVREPKVFLLDEPLSNLDAKLRGHMRAELHRLYRSLGATIIYVTHDQTEAMTLGTRIVVLRDGVVQQVDTPRGVYEKPVNTFVASFIGTPPMNLFPACLVQEQGEFLLRHQDGGLALPAAKASAAHLRPWLGSTVIAGIRPEHACLHTASPAMGKGLPGTVEMVERTGAESFVAVRTGYGSMVVRVPPDLPVSLSSPVLLTFDAEHVHLFDAGSQMRIL
jgi:multiple sugar transport system ATP-binding protein